VAELTIDGVTASGLARRWGVPRVDLYGVTPSALDAVHALAAARGASGSVVIADQQTAGRGRDGPTWWSPPGGVWLGMLMGASAAAARTLAIRAGLAVAEGLDALLGGPVTQLKWPNDVVLDNRKVGGILCEARWQGTALQGLAMGVGINVVNALPPELAGRAIALSELVPGVRRLDVLDALVPTLARISGEPAPLGDAELAAFAARDWLRGRLLRRPVAGRAAGLRADGALLVEVGTSTAGVQDGRVELA
jgi:BirA family biotin operon repressor/biotin-[acetyl-CoA-carboxylase] ligase